MSDVVELARLVRQVLDEHERNVRLALDEFEARLGALEAGKPPPRYSLAEGVAARRRVVVRLREHGLSMPQIASMLGASLATIERDLDAVPHRTPEYVTGRDGKSHPARKAARGA